MSKITSENIQELINRSLNKKFFKENIPSQMSAYSILDFTLSVNIMDEQLYKLLPDENKAQIQAENKRVEEEEDVDKLYNMLRKSLNPATVNIIIDRLMKQKDTIIPRILEDLKRSGNDNFVESSARILIKLENNYSKELENILPQIKYPYTQAVVCYVLGKIGEEEHINTLYNYYKALKSNYKDEIYYEGPLLGLHEMKIRFQF